ncbi:MAG TPA: zf-HC2 domain-containing protein [Chthonomonadaceae bacterium]|nr:zf-HC2 domain-containing protein [Chthonomonadaceae bacterium]
MKCHRAVWLASYGRDHTLSEQERAALEAHLGSCPACRQRQAAYSRLVNALSAQQEPEPAADLLQKAIRQAQETVVESSPANGRTAQRVRLALALVVLVVLVGTRLPQAFGQSVLQKMEAAVGQARTMHVVSWEFLMTEEEARNHTWHDGKTPVRTETWVTHDAISGRDDLMGPYLWNATGYLHYDPTERKMKYLQFAGREVSLKDTIERSFNPVAEMKSAVTPGTYLSLHNFADAVWQGRKVHKLQIASGPDKPKAGEEVPTTQEPGRTPPPGAAPRMRRTFWIDRETNLPVHAEYEKEIQGRWVVQTRSDYDYNLQTPARLFDPEAIRKDAEAHAARRH